MKVQYIPILMVLLASFVIAGCSYPQLVPPTATHAPVGCASQVYPPPASSPYILPFQVGASFKTGLTNCSSSFHRTGEPDQYAFDFDMPLGTPFIAARGGTVYDVVEDAPSAGGGTGNYVLIEHEDGTFAYYLHSPKDGIDVAIGDHVEQGDVLGITGQSGLAGYPHLHFIVVESPPEYPYQGLAISFSNAEPQDPILRSYTLYMAVPFE
jgi:murein DD-endopeptidase MepM/ murein hydrolase activator NlpD